MKALKRVAVYLDLCALERPYDDQSYPRIEAESAAVTIITCLIKTGVYKLYYSPTHHLEMNRGCDKTIRTEISLLFSEYGNDTSAILTNMYQHIEKYALAMESKGMGLLDAMHVAQSESIGAAFVTCDDDLIKKCRICEVSVWFGTPIDFCKKEGLL